MKEPVRCGWVQNGGPLDVAYHDQEWGVPCHDERRLFEFLILEGAQAGLSWTTILKKRDAYRAAFAEFDPALVARFSARDQARLLQDPGIVRNRLKVAAAVTNAGRFLELQREHGTCADYLWAFVNGRAIDGRRRAPRDVPATTPLSDSISKDLKKRGFTFVGSTIIYAYMQAIGLVNDHLLTCFRHPQVSRGRI
jgi:DNA-3-methyladenine glycosylase I